MVVEVGICLYLRTAHPILEIDGKPFLHKHHGYHRAGSPGATLAPSVNGRNSGLIVIPYTDRFYNLR